jgi:hypothetical protein
VRTTNNAAGIICQRERIENRKDIEILLIGSDTFDGVVFTG